VKRFALALFILLSWLILIGTAASAQTPTGGGFPPQSVLFNDALFLARAAPFIVALGILAGIVQARAAAQGGGDAIVGERVRRHDLSTVVAHWANAAGVILGLATGAIVLRWVDYRPELRLVFIIHYAGAALMLFAIFNHLTRHGVSGGTGLIPKRLNVIRDLIGELLEYAGVFGPAGAVLRIPWPKAIRQPIARYARALLSYQESRAGKYLATEQTISYPPWAILMGLIVVTGLIKVLRYVYVIPNPVVATATAIHDVTTIAIGVMLIIHLLPLLLIPANWPLLLSMFRTTVPRKYVEERHPAWYRELKTPQSREEPDTVTSPERSEHGPAQTVDA
jgi:cytochrome b subunit of formate dehydrogenase